MEKIEERMFDSKTNSVFINNYLTSLLVIPGLPRDLRLLWPPCADGRLRGKLRMKEVGKGIFVILS